MIHWMRDVPDKWGYFRVKAECSCCGEQSEHVLACETGATTSAVRALEGLGWLSFGIDRPAERRVKEIGVCPNCALKVPWLVRAVEGDGRYAAILREKNGKR